MKKFTAAVLFLFLILCLAACGRQPAAPAAPSASPAGAAAASSAPAEANAKLTRSCANIALFLPEGWKYAEVNDDGRFGLKFWPEAEPGVSAVLWYWTNTFGMCGTGVTFETVALPSGLTATRATEESSSGSMYDLIYRDTPGSYVGECFTSKTMWDKYGAVISDIFGTAVLGQGNLSASEAVRASESACAMECDSDRTRAVFDYLSGAWTVTLVSADGKTSKTAVISPDGTAEVTRNEAGAA